MKLTTREAKLVERLRKQERQWPRLRWLVLGTGIFAAIGSIFIVLTLTDHFNIMLGEPNDVMPRIWLLWFAMLQPSWLIGFLIAGWQINWAITDWHGNTNRALLLRLLDAQQEEELK
jgi:polyferredoxin